MKGDLDRAVEYAELMAETATLPLDRGSAQLVHGYALCKSGMPDKGIDLMAPMLEFFEERGTVVYEWHFGAFLADGYLLAGRYEEARQTAEKVVQSASVGGARPWLGFAQRVLGEVALKTNPCEAPPHFEQAISIFQRNQSRKRTRPRLLRHGPLPQAAREHGAGTKVPDRKPWKSSSGSAR